MPQQTAYAHSIKCIPPPLPLPTVPAELPTSDNTLTTASGMREIHPAIEPLFQKLGSLCTLPAVAEKVLQVTDNDDSDADDLLAVIEQDPAIATRLMKVVNSAYCGLRNPVADLKTAITMLGVEQVRNLALTLSIGGVFGRPTPVGGLDPERLWDHSVCVATISRLVAVKGKHCHPDEAYLAGLLHDLGLLFTNQHLEKLVPRVMVRLKTGLPLNGAEQQILGFDHAQLGAYVAWRSNFPERIVTAIDYHHDPIDCPEEGRSLTHVVVVANYLATRFERGSIEGRRLPAPPEEVLKPMGLNLSALRHLWAELPEAMAHVSQLTA